MSDRADSIMEMVRAIVPPIQKIEQEVNSLETDLFQHAAESRRLLECAERLRGALTDEALVSEIAMQLRPYEPIGQEKVLEMLDDIRQGIAIYLKDRGLDGAEIERFRPVKPHSSIVTAPADDGKGRKSAYDTTWPDLHARGGKP